MLSTAASNQTTPQCVCGNSRFSTVFTYTQPPPGETRFEFSAVGRYYREVLRCMQCGHFVSIHDMDLSGLYSSEYVASTYGNSGIQRNFDRIISLPAERSDNTGRVKRINAFASERLTLPAREHRQPSVLDIGSGLCVFLHLMKKAGWQCTAIDPDPRMVRHACEVVGVHGVCGDFMELQNLGLFDLITFNKVLEHVQDPVAMLAKSRQFLRKGGLVYVEVPDGEAAAKDGQGREEFFIEHRHIFSLASMNILALKAGFKSFAVERLQEPSTKYTLYAFFRP